jgi:peptidoglycan/LPS O-acetylase OafA/YrhL
MAAVMVFFFHAAGHYRVLGGQSQVFLELSGFGFSGVDIFFVISGFVVAHTTLGKSRTLSSACHFSKRRLMRVYLGYWPFYALAILIAYIYEPNVQAEQQFLLSFFLSTIDAKGMVLFVSWSLTFELIFYAIVTATFGISVEAFKRLVQVCGIGVLLILVWVDPTHHSSYVSFVSSLLEFIAGMTVYMHKDRLVNRWLSVPLAGVVCVAFFLGAHLHATNDSVRLFTFGTGAVALVMLAVLLEQSRTAIASAVLVAFGDGSYTLYLAHPAILSVFYFWGIRDFLALQPTFVREAGFFLYLGLGMCVSQLIYVWVERPLYRWVSSPKTLA